MQHPPCKIACRQQNGLQHWHRKPPYVALKLCIWQGFLKISCCAGWPLKHSPYKNLTSLDNGLVYSQKSGIINWLVVDESVMIRASKISSHRTLRNIIILHFLAGKPVLKANFLLPYCLIKNRLVFRLNFCTAFTTFCLFHSGHCRESQTTIAVICWL